MVFVNGRMFLVRLSLKIFAINLNFLLNELLNEFV